jgi:hypothetical protein
VLIIASSEAAVIVAVSLIMLRIILSLLDGRREAEAQWVLERRELLTRIQRPEIVPTRDVAEFELPEREPDEWGKVGAVDIDPDYGLSDDG